MEPFTNWTGFIVIPDEKPSHIKGIVVLSNKPRVKGIFSFFKKFNNKYYRIIQLFEKPGFFYPLIEYSPDSRG